MNRDHFWRSISRDTNVVVSALSPVFPSIDSSHSNWKLSSELTANCRPNGALLEHSNKWAFVASDIKFPK